MTRRHLLATAASAAAMAQTAPAFEVGAYYFPNFHVDPRNEAVHGPGWTEWELVKQARPRFPGHGQPKRPAWGYENEADPAVMARKIDAAANHGLSYFIFDWYWYEDGPFLNRALEQGFLKAPNNSRLKFCLMWANHDWVDIMPAKRKVPPPLLYRGVVSRAAFDRMADHCVSTYFRHPSYWTISGRPYFSIYELYRLVEGLGGVAKTRDALRDFRRKTRAAGLPDVHLNAVVWGVKLLPNEKQLTNAAAILKALEFDSVTSYVWVHHVGMNQFPFTPYARVAETAAGQWAKLETDHGLPYYPNVSMGWDPSPRTVQTDVYSNEGYPFTPILDGNTPAAFRASLESARAWLESDPRRPRILNINAWNEWTEGSYLEPDTTTGTEYLEAVRAVFGGR